MTSNSNDSVIFVGDKQPMSYVLAVITQFQKGAKEVFVKARGRLTSRAIDVVEIVKNKFIKDVKIGEVKISTEQMKGEKGDVNVSVISISLTK
ncbi:DNA/RNA-binding protein Alba [Candidatus Tiddalikarchaeum anstoanum]|nr:DNA/RNA-binding protein Alba [Candidatus Tiddalikarchaeum anstoanum]